MKLFVAALAAVAAFGAVLAPAAARADDEVDDPDVVVLTTANFDEVVGAAPLMAVEFYAPWCGHCKRLAPEWAKAATRLKADDPPVLLGKVDATIEGELASKYDVSGYPTIVLFRNGEKSEYNGPRDEAGIVKYLRGQAGPSAKPLADAAAVAKFLAFDEDVSIVAYVGADAAAAFTKAADRLREELRFGVAASPADGGANANKIVCHRPASWKGEAAAVVFDGDASDADAIAAWAMRASVPLAGVYSADTQARYAGSELARITLWATVDQTRDPSGYRYFMNRLRKVAKEFDGKLHFVLADKAGAAGRDYGELGFAPDAKFGLGAVSPDGYRYRADAAAADGAKFSVDMLRQFATDFLAGSVEKYVKSEPVPEPNDGPVRTVVGKTFEDEVTNAKHNVFIEFYAPWCGHCKSLAPTWDKLGEAFKDDERVVIAKIDATANDHSKAFDVRGFPTLYWSPANGGAPESYEGGRDFADLKKFVAKKLKEAGKTEL